MKRIGGSRDLAKSYVLYYQTMHFDRFLAISQDLAVLNAFIFIEIVRFIVENHSFWEVSAV